MAGIWTHNLAHLKMLNQLHYMYVQTCKLKWITQHYPVSLPMGVIISVKVLITFLASHMWYVGKQRRSKSETTEY